MADDILYEHDRVKVTYLHSPEPGKQDEIISHEDHELWLKGKDGEWSSYAIPRGVLKELLSVANETSRLVDMLDRVNPLLTFNMGNEGIPLEDVVQAISAAHQKEDHDFEAYRIEQKK
jgi:hypothetical protein